MVQAGVLLFSTATTPVPKRMALSCNSEIVYVPCPHSLCFAWSASAPPDLQRARATFVRLLTTSFFLRLPAFPLCEISGHEMFFLILPRRLFAGTQASHSRSANPLSATGLLQHWTFHAQEVLRATVLMWSLCSVSWEAGVLFHSNPIADAVMWTQTARWSMPRRCTPGAAIAAASTGLPVR